MPGLAPCSVRPGRSSRHCLYLSPNTIKTHTRALYRKLGVSDRQDAVAKARQLGLV